MKRGNIHSPTIYPLPPLNPDLYYHPGSEADLCDVPDTIRLLPMAEFNSFPQLVSSISIEDPGTISFLSGADVNGYLGLFALRHFDVDPLDLRKEDFYPVGVAARVLSVAEGQAGQDSVKAAVQGICRLSLSEVIPAGPLARARRLDEPHVADDSLRPLMLEAKRLFAEAIKLIPGLPVNLFKINHILDGQPAVLADLIMASMPLKTSLKAEFLAVGSLKDRYHLLLEHLTLDVATRKAGRAISSRIESSLASRYKEQQLREQLKAIKAELGDADDSDDLSEISGRLDRSDLPEAVRASAARELQRLRLTPAQSAEYPTIRNFLEWLLGLPWNKSSEGAASLPEAKAILDRDHQGLDAAKKRILEFLAVHKLTNGLAAPILCLVGPPGVGKTSLGRSMAEAMGRKFQRLSLGGMKDEAEIRGHRRTYVGAAPGRIISGLRKAGVNNPVFLLDEIDKVGQSHAGDPAAALLEVLDPEQNDSFTDSFLELPFDLSRVLFVLTANVAENIPAPLRDRLEIIEIPGYTVEEKVGIASRHLWPRELGRHGLAPDEVAIGPEVLARLIGNYTWEAGCRELGRRLGALARGRAMAKAEGTDRPPLVSAEELRTVLGPPCRRNGDNREKEPQTGVVTGLAWTAAGGDIMFVEAVSMPGKGQLSLTGQLGEVMRESAQAAICYVRSRAKDWFLYDGWFQENDVHIHLPHGAIHKDGPSAGVSMATAVVSLVTGQKVRPEVAMTGEITLRGLVLPVGGLKEKLLAARRAGLSRVLVPEGNMADLQELGDSLTEGLEVTPVATLDDVLEMALLPPDGLFESEAYSPAGALAGTSNAWTAALQFRASKLVAIGQLPVRVPETPNLNAAWGPVSPGMPNAGPRLKEA
ncbi:MAG: endopeptidase La [Deltaproteobacteria bacterium]|nr:endopeptidase La [Deltaproteobacteria bacterium]